MRLQIQSGDRLQKAQYSPSKVRAYEAIYGKDFLSPGGRDMASRLLSEAELQPGWKVLDVGAGVGGCAFLMAEEFGLNIEGIDLSSRMMAEANRRCRERGLQERVKFQTLNCLELEKSEYYEGVVSRDVFLHIHQKRELFEGLYRALKPGGILFFTDYCCNKKPWPWSFTAYVEARNYCLHTLEEYRELLEETGFCDVRARDVSELFLETLRRELAQLGESNELSWPTRMGLKLAWKMKLNRARGGSHRWGLFWARKPQS